MHCSGELLQQQKLGLRLLPWRPPEQVLVTFRRGHTAAQLLAAVSQALQQLAPAVSPPSDGCGVASVSETAADKTELPLPLTPEVAQVCLLDLKEVRTQSLFSASR